MRLILAVAVAIAIHMVFAARRAVVVRVPTTRTAALGAMLAGVAVVIGLPVVAAITIGVSGPGVPGLVAMIRSRRTAAAARDRWPDFIAIVRSRIGAGDPLPDAVRTAARLLAGPFLELDRAWGGSFVAELEAARARWADPVADRVLTTLRIAASTGGGHVDAVLSALSSSLSDEMRMRSAHDAALAQQRMTAGAALVSPWVILALSVATNPQAGDAFSAPIGRAILTGGGVATVAGYLLARRAARLSEPPRVFG